MAAKDTTPPLAFACAAENGHQPGMLLRDYFAAAALAGGLEQGVRDNMDMHWWRGPKEVAERAYAVADAMLKARERK